MKSIISAVVFTFLPLAAGAGSYTPVSSQETTEAELIEVIRRPYERKLEQPVVFKVRHAEVEGEWGFIRGVLRRPEGGWIDYANTRFRPGFEEGDVDDGFCALVQLTRGRWTVIAYSVGTKEVPWFTWADYYHAPESIFK